MDILAHTCSKCGKTKPTTHFHKNKSTKSGLSSWCKLCACNNVKEWRNNNKDREAHSQRVAHYRRKYNISLEEYDSLLKLQDYKCAICSCTEDSNRVQTWLCIDHDHTTGKIRGLLCDYCNVALGRLNDDPELLQKAIKYLEKKDG